MSGNSQKFIARNRAPRVQIEYDVELYGAEKKVQLPFVMGVMSDLSGKSNVAQPSAADRSFLEIDVDNFDSRMKAMQPRAAFSVPNTLTGEGNLSIDLTFEKMDDFSPAAIASKVDSLRPLLEARTQLSDLMAYMDGKSGAETLIETILADTGLLAAISGAPGNDTDNAAALESLRALTPEDTVEQDTSAGILDGLRQAAPADEEKPDDLRSALQSLASVEIVEEETNDDVSSALNSLADVEIVEEAVDTTDDLLADLAAAAPDEVEVSNDVGSALDSLSDVEIAEEAVDTTDDLLADLAAAAPDEVDVSDGVGSALDSLSDVEIAEEAVDTTDDLLADLAAGAPDEVDVSDGVGSALDSLVDVEVAEEAVDTTDDLLADLVAGAPDEVEVSDGVGSALDSLSDVEIAEEAVDTTDDLLADLAAGAPDEEDVSDGVGSALDSLADIEIAEEAVDTTDDLLTDLAADAPDEVEVSDGVGSALDSLADVEIAEEAVDTTDDLLADLAADAPDEVEISDGVGSALDSLSDVEIAEEAVDTTDDLLADLATSDDVDDLDDLDDLLGDLGSDDAENTSDDALNEALAGTGDESSSDAENDLDDLLSGVGGSDDDLDDLMAGLESDDGAEEASDDLDDWLTELESGDTDDVADTPTDDLDDLLGDLGDIDDAAMDDLDDLMAGLESDDTDDSAETSTDDLDDLLGDLDDTDELDDVDDLLGDLSDDGETNTDDLDSLMAELGDESSDKVQMEEPEFAYGQMNAERPESQKLNRKRFRLAILGDFSARAARGLLETGDALAARPPILLDPDTVEDVIEGFATDLVLPIGKDGAGVAIKLGGLDDLHPDELYENVELFSELVGLRGQLSSGVTADHAAQTLRAWGEKHGTPVAPTRAKSAGNTVPADLKLSDFQKLIGDTKAELTQPSPIEDLLARVVGPHIRVIPDADTVAMQGAVEEALSAAMRMVLHHPEFQSVEGQWRSLDLIARSIETDDTLDVVLYDISAEEIAADLATADDLGTSGFVRLLTEEPLDEENGRGGYSALIGLYTFEETPPHAAILGRIARVAAHVDAPFFTAITPTFFDTEKQDRHPLVANAWDTLRAMPEAKHLGIVSPRFLLRRPYGAKSEPIYEFKFEEFTMAEGLSGMLWANPAILVAILLAKSFRENGASMQLGSIMSLGDIPFHYIDDSYGDQVALPCTERNLTLDKVEKAVVRGYMSVVSIKGRDEVRLASFQSLGGGEILGPWSGVAPPDPSPPKPTPVQAEETGETEDEEEDDLNLDDLLAGFADDDDDDMTSDDDLDADLAALLGDL